MKEQFRPNEGLPSGQEGLTPEGANFHTGSMAENGGETPQNSESQEQRPRDPDEAQTQRVIDETLNQMSDEDWDRFVERSPKFAEDLATVNEKARAALERRRAAVATAETTPEEVEEAARHVAEEAAKEEDIAGEQEHETILGRMKQLLEDPRVIAELEKDQPDFNSDALKDLTSFLAHELNATRDEFIVFADAISTRSRPYELVGRRRGGEETGITIDTTSYSEEARKVLFEWTVEKIIGAPEKRGEEYQYDLGSLQIRANLDELNALVLARFDEDFTRYIGNLVNVRQIAHELRRNLSLGDSYKEYIQKELKGPGLDFIRNEMAGISDVVRLYEEAAGRKLAETHEWFSNGDITAIDNEVEATIKEMQDAGLLKDRVGRRLTEWEVERAISMGKTFLAGTQRLALYSAFGNLPSSTTGRIGSIPYEYIMRTLFPFKSTSLRYFSREPGGKAYMDRIFEEEKAGEGHLKTNSLFGIDERVMRTNAYGSFDPESHGWRSNLMFLGNIRIKDEYGAETTMMDFLNRKMQGFGAVIDDAYGVMKSIEGEANNAKYLESVQNFVLGQTLYLSVLARHDSFGGSTKIEEGFRTKIWEKIAVLNPSAVASYLPEIVGEDKELWNSEEFKRKVYIANAKRVNKEKERYFDKNGNPIAQDNMELAHEAKPFIDGSFKNSDELKYQFLEYFSGENELTPEERALLKKVIDAGIDKAGYLANSKIRYNMILNDTPYIAWKRTGFSKAGSSEEDLFRIFLSDQANINKSWEGINKLVEKPTTGYIEAFTEFVEANGQVFGRHTAQSAIEPFITGFVKLASKDTLAEWAPLINSLKRLKKEPTSEVEKYFRTAFLSLDTHQRRDVLIALSQAGAIADDLSTTKREKWFLFKKRTKTQLEKMLAATKSAREWVALKSIITFLEIFFTIGVFEVGKSVAPEEISKSLS